MDDHVKQIGLWAGIGAAAGVGLALGLGLRFLATGALLALGAGAALGIVTAQRRGGPRMLPASQTPALH